MRMKSNEVLACCVIALGVCGVVAGSLLTEPTAPVAAPAPTATVQPTPEPTPEPTPTPTINPKTVLYYNKDGGSYYHADKNCSKVADNYLPLTGTFKYSEINDSKYKNLKPCDRCNPPERP